MKGKLAIAALFALSAAGLAPVLAKTQAGVLTCNVEGGAGLIIGSQKDMRCVFNPSGKGESERYTGVITRVGLDVGFTGEATMTWVVLAPSSDIGGGALRGTYAGASAEASAGVGGGANILIGGSNDTISLQPLSVKGQTGLNAALGIAALELR